MTTPVRTASSPTPAPPVRRRGVSVAVFATLGLLIAVGTVGWTAYVALSVFARQQSTLSTSFAGIDSISVSGDVSVTVTATLGESTVLDQKAQWSFRRPSIAIVRDGGHLSIRGHCPVEVGWSCAVSLGLRVPATTAVDLSSRYGDVIATGMAADATLRSDDGNVTVDGGTGGVNAHSGNGDVTITRSRASDIDAQTDSGTVRVQLDASPNTVRATSDSGDVTVGLPDESGVAYRIDATDNDDGATVSVRPDPSSPRHITAHSGSGDVRIFYN